MVVSDLIMPDIGGKELYLELMEEHARTSPLRMLLVTGYAQEELAHLREGASVIKWLHKPFSMETFAHRVAETLHDNHPVER
jgi:response regulator RpfG family c-di-GMP phosphodiesterase